MTNRRHPRTFAPWAYWLFIGAVAVIAIAMFAAITLRVLG